jgi:hypothetical protein
LAQLYCRRENWLYRGAVTQIARRRTAAVLLVVGIVVGALALADIGPFEDPPTADERAAEAVEEFFAAAAAGDGATFCGLLTEDARSTLRVNIAQRLRTDDPPGCEQLMTALKPVFEGSTVQIRFVNVSGNRARVETRYKPKDSAAEPRTVLLLEEDGAWRISDPG